MRQNIIITQRMEIILILIKVHILWLHFTENCVVKTTPTDYTDSKLNTLPFPRPLTVLKPIYISPQCALIKYINLFPFPQLSRSV